MGQFQQIIRDWTIYLSKLFFTLILHACHIHFNRTERTCLALTDPLQGSHMDGVGSFFLFSFFYFFYFFAILYCIRPRMRADPCDGSVIPL